MKTPLVSIIVTTRNNAETISACLDSITKQSYKNIGLLVIDNSSTDSTKDIAFEYTKNVFDKGPERSAQRNFGVKKAKGEYVLIIDSDMELTQDVVKACVEKSQSDSEAQAIIIPEESFGTGFWAQCKRLERSFYVGVDGIEAPRFFEKKLYQRIGGYNETMTGGEDWELSERIAQYTNIIRIGEFIMHNEGRFSLRAALKKKAYYTNGFTQYYYVNRNPRSVGTKSIGNILKYYKIYFSHPLRLFKNPLYGIGMLFMKTLEFGVAGIGLLRSRGF